MRTNAQGDLGMNDGDDDKDKDRELRLKGLAYLRLGLQKKKVDAAAVPRSRGTSGLQYSTCHGPGHSTTSAAETRCSWSSSSSNLSL